MGVSKETPKNSRFRDLFRGEQFLQNTEALESGNTIASIEANW